MNVTVFNASLLVGWLVFSGGAVMVHPGFGMAAAGLMLLVLTLLVARIFGLQQPDQTIGRGPSKIRLAIQRLLFRQVAQKASG